jgi:hypothetical protein
MSSLLTLLNTSLAFLPSWSWSPIKIKVWRKKKKKIKVWLKYLKTLVKGNQFLLLDKLQTLALFYSLLLSNSIAHKNITNKWFFFKPNHKNSDNKLSYAKLWHNLVHAHWPLTTCSQAMCCEPFQKKKPKT